MIGSRVGFYEITALLGKGGMGEVYRALDTRLKREVAVKILPQEFSQDHDRVSRFQREAEVLASVNHPNIAGIHDLQQDQGFRFLVLELVEGDTLADLLSKRGALPLEEILNVAKQICEGLEAAHDKGIIHRDLKPANIKVTPDGSVKLLDFGLARIFESEVTQPDASHSPTMMSRSMPGMILGTAAYMSPEQARGHAVNRLSDNWAFGCVLYEMLTGKQTFTGETVTDTLGGVVRLDPDWSAVPPSTPQSLKNLLKRCLAKDKRRRLQHIGDARLEIEQLLADPPAAAAPESATAPRQSRLPWGIAIASLLMSVITSVPAARYFLQPAVEPPERRFEIQTPPTLTRASFAVSPDGRRLVYTAMKDGRNVLWVRPLDSVTATALAGTEDAQFPFWSPDSRSIGFFAEEKLKRVDATAGQPKVVTATSPTPRGGTWNKDDIIVFTPGSNSGLMRVSAQGGSPEELTKLDAAQTSHRFPVFLPDGRHFLYWAQSESPEIHVASLEAPQGVKLVNSDTSATFTAGFLFFGLQSSLYAQAFDAERLQLTGERFLVSENIATQNIAIAASAGGGVFAFRPALVGGRRQLQWIDRSGKPGGIVGPPDPTLSELEIAPNGKQAAILRSTSSNVDVWVVEIARGLFSRFTSTDGTERWPTWSPDGTRVAYEPIVNSSSKIFSRSLDGEETLLFDGKRAGASPSDWSPDGKHLLYLAAGTDLFAVPVAGNPQPFPFANTPFIETRGQFSPDGRWVAYESNESSRFEIYVKSFPAPGRQWQISIDGGIQPRWHPNGKEIFFISPDEKLMSAEVRASGDGKTLDVASPRLLFQARIFLGGTKAGAFKFVYDLAPDGNRFLINTPLDADGISPIIVVLNWKGSVSR